MRRSIKIAIGTIIFSFATYRVVKSNYNQQIYQQRQAVPQEPVPQTEIDGMTATKYFRFGSSNIPHITKVAKGGEDAWIAAENLLVVADGVGGWIQHGIDSGLFSKSLVFDIHQKFIKNEAQELKNILVESVKINKNIGSSTCVLVKFDTSKENQIKTTNLGDSGYLILRPVQQGNESYLKLLFKSKEQQYRFNFPYQCGTGSPLPYNAFDNQHEIQDNDILVLASDGMLDNLYNQDVVDCIEPLIKGVVVEDLMEASYCLASKAEYLGDLKGYLSPFAKGAREAGVYYPLMGKSDDIAVIVAQIHPKGQGPNGSKYQQQKIQTNGVDTTHQEDMRLKFNLNSINQDL